MSRPASYQALHPMSGCDITGGRKFVSLPHLGIEQRCGSAQISATLLILRWALCLTRFDLGPPFCSAGYEIKKLRCPPLGGIAARFEVFPPTALVLGTCHYQYIWVCSIVYYPPTFPATSHLGIAAFLCLVAGWICQCYSMSRPASYQALHPMSGCDITGGRKFVLNKIKNLEGGRSHCLLF